MMLSTCEKYTGIDTEVYVDINTNNPSSAIVFQRFLLWTFSITDTKLIAVLKVSVITVFEFIDRSSVLYNLVIILLVIRCTFV